MFTVDFHAMKYGFIPIELAIGGLLAYELVSGRAGIRMWGIDMHWYMREERPGVYWLLVGVHVIFLAVLLAGTLHG